MLFGMKSCLALLCLAPFHCALFCCVLLRCAVLCCVVPCFAVLCCVVLCCAVVWFPARVRYYGTVTFAFSDRSLMCADGDFLAHIELQGHSFRWP
mmetsp:Transcript_129327/g.295073  ORF Transcript_129327/g.295073 Transcript_129327/m.295073 type:complete len:95 (+) Transcript_129327:1153-1437(+)